MAPISEGVDTSSLDLYELLSISATSTESEIRRAYRKTSLLYHPDKVTPTPETLEKFQLLQHALQVLTDVAERAKYDSGREAKLRRAAETAALESRRRKMKEDLEKREVTGSFPSSSSAAAVNGTKRTWSERELTIKRIAEENRRRKEEAMRRKTEEAQKAATTTATEKESLNNGSENSSSAVERSVKVRWVKQGDGLEIDDTALREMFPAGEVEDVVILKDKKKRRAADEDGAAPPDDDDHHHHRKKIVLGTAVLVFKSLAAAKRAVARGKTDELESVAWAAAVTTTDKAAEKEAEPS